MSQQYSNHSPISSFRFLYCVGRGSSICWSLTTSNEAMATIFGSHFLVWVALNRLFGRRLCRPFSPQTHRQCFHSPSSSTLSIPVVLGSEAPCEGVSYREQVLVRSTVTINLTDIVSAALWDKSLMVLLNYPPMLFVPVTFSESLCAGASHRQKVLWSIVVLNRLFTLRIYRRFCPVHIGNGNASNPPI